MTIPEEAGKVATVAIEAFRGSPACLASVGLAALFAVLTYMSMLDERGEFHARQMALITGCMPHQKDDPAYSYGGSR